MKTFALTIGLLLPILLCSQVGIGTTSPSNAAMLEVSSTADGGTTYGGFMPPRVPSITERDAINPNVADIGLTVFVENLRCLQIWNGTAWESIHCTNAIEFTGVVQNFDLGTTWGYSSDVPFFNNGVNGFYGVTNASNSIFSNLITLTNNFLGIRDLDDLESGNGTAGFATITFNEINVSAAYTGVFISFDWEFFEIDNGDDGYYTLIIDGIPQTRTQFIDGTGNFSDSGSVLLSAPGGTSTISLIIEIDQSGEADVIGLDNFRIYPQ